MVSLLIGSSLALIFAFIGTPLFIRFLVRKSYGQFVRDDGPTSHHTKRGTPTMGGAVIVASVVASYSITHLISYAINPGSFGPSASGLLVFLMVGMGMVGFIDDYTKISRQRSLGLNAKAKIILQTLVGVAFAILALNFPNDQGRTPASTKISFIRDTNFDLAFAGTLIGAILFIVWANLIITGTSNGVNLADGLDGLAAGASILVFGAYFLIGIWQSNQSCGARVPEASVTKSGTPWTWPCWQGPWPGRSWASSGGTPPRPRSSWATPGLWPSEVPLRHSPFSRAPSCCS